jgi:fatty-acyl-CoA synthase
MGTVAVPSYDSGTSDRPLLGDTIGAVLDRVADAQPDAEAMVDVPTGRRWTYGQLRDAADDVALGLLAAGLGRGDRVGIWAPNQAEWTLVQFGTAKIGAILVNINPAYRSHELQYVLRQAGTTLLVAAASFKDADYAAMIEQVRPACPDLRQVVLLDRPEWAGLLAAGSRGDRARRAELPGPQSPAQANKIPYTTGNTG